MSHSALVTDLASLLDSLLNDRDGDELFRAARLILDGYQRVTPLEPIELRFLRRAPRRAGRGDDRDLVVALGTWPRGRHVRRALQRPGRRRRSRRCSRSAGTRWRAGSGRTSGDVPRRRRWPLDARRRSVRRSSRSPTTSRSTSSSASGVWMTAADGRRYLDAYNNVPCRRARPPAGGRGDRPAGAPAQHQHALPARDGHRARRAAHRDDAARPGLDTVMFVNSGSEANDLAWRLATTPHGQRRRRCAPTSRTTASPRPPPPCRPSRGRPDAGPTMSRRGRRPTPARDGPRRRVVRGRAGAAGRPRAGAGRGHPRRRPDQRRLPGRRAGAGRRVGRADPRGRRACGSPTRSRAATAGPARRCGRSSGSASPRTSSRSASRWATATRSGRSSPAARSRRGSRTRPCSSARSAGNPVSAAAALAVLDVLDDERVLERVTETGRRCATRSATIARPYPVVRRRPRRGSGHRRRGGRRPDRVGDQGRHARARRADRHVPAAMGTSSRSARPWPSRRPRCRSSWPPSTATLAELGATREASAPSRRPCPRPRPRAGNR